MAIGTRYSTAFIRAFLRGSAAIAKAQGVKLYDYLLQICERATTAVAAGQGANVLTESSADGHIVKWAVPSSVSAITAQDLLELVEFLLTLIDSIQPPPDSDPELLVDLLNSPSLSSAPTTNRPDFSTYCQ